MSKKDFVEIELKFIGYKADNVLTDSLATNGDYEDAIDSSGDVMWN